MRPLIGLTTDYRAGNTSASDPEPTYFLRARYARAIESLGGLPVLLPITPNRALLAELLRGLDGLLITGSGPDLDPALYREPRRSPHQLMAPARAAFELALTRAALAAGMPLLGICGGMQLLNVALGGSLVQDIAAEVPAARPHQESKEGRVRHHEVRLIRGTRLQAIYRRHRLRVNSAHHQAPRRLGRGLVVGAVADDGIIEALELPTHPFAVGVQWHPERMVASDPIQRRLFRSFLSASRRRSR